VAFAFLACARSAYGDWLRAGRSRGRFSRPVLVVGSNDEAVDLCHLIDSHPEVGYRVCGLVGDPGEIRSRTDLPCLGSLDDVVSVVEASGVNGVIVAASAVPSAQLNRTIRALMRAGVHVHLSSGLTGIDYRRVRSLPLAHEPLFYLEPLAPSQGELALKRALDIVLASIGLLLSLPVLLAAALIVKLSDRGPVLYRHERVGQGAKPFTIYKLRTMVVGAEERLDEVRRSNQRFDGPLFKADLDPRVTRIGRFLRTTSIDELPQLFNVLNGTMSLVGPRPALPTEVAQFDDELLTRLQVKPGITGLWQVEARDNPSFYVYRRLDLFYLENWSVGLDLAILLGTFQAVVGRSMRALTGTTPEGAELRLLD
jgi:exopolysaccharide biosynthesis polyprenyl glycosylphosphotransferase